MLKTIKRVLTVFGVLLLVAFVLFMVRQIEGLALFAARMDPAWEPWAYWSLMAVFGLSLFWLLGTIFLRPRPLLVPENPTEKELKRFQSRLAGRLEKNRYLRHLHLDMDKPDCVRLGLAELNKRANEEIKSTARKVFIATAVSQNGKADSLIVLATLARLVWVIARLYNQRPHYRELTNLYLNVAASSLLASRIEDMEIEEHIHQVVSPVIATSAIGAIPGAGAVAATVTASVIDGSANALLALRAGIIARNYMSLNLQPGTSPRKMATPEATRMLVEITADTVSVISCKLARATAKVVGERSKKAVQSMVAVARNSSQTVSDAVGKGARATVHGLHWGVRATADAVGAGADAVGDAASSLFTRKKTDKDSCADQPPIAGEPF